MSLRKDIKKLVDAAAAAGARIDDRGEKWLVYCPDGKTIVTIHKTPSVQGALDNARRRMRKGGIEI